VTCGAVKAVVTAVAAAACCLAAAAAEGSLTLLDAIRLTLARHPLLHIQEEQVAYNRGVRQQLSGQFDSVFSNSLALSRSNTPLTQLQKWEVLQAGMPLLSNDASNNAREMASYQQLFRNGVSVNPSIAITHAGDPLQNTTGANITQVAFTLNIPLLRGRGRDVVAAQETAAGIEVDASLLDLNQQIANLIDQTAERYWNLRAAQSVYEVAAESEQRGLVFVENVRALIEADKAPRAELNQVMANLAERTSSRLAAQQRVFEARQQLALSLGVSSQELSAAVGMLADDLPEGEDRAMPSDAPGDVEYYLNQALGNRADVLAARRRQDEARVLLTAARNQLLPQLNLSLNGGYTGMREGHRVDQYLFSLYGLHGPDAAASLTYVFPAANNAAKGQLVQADSATRQAVLKTGETERQVSAGVLIAMGALRNSVQRLKKARESVTYYQAALDGERDKWRLGIGTLVDTLTMEDRLTGVQGSYVSSKLAYAIALVQFRLATGTLMAPGKAAQNLDTSLFTTLPFLGRPRGNP
jgi:outer membrane protein